MSEFRSICWEKDEWENLVIDIYHEPQSNEDKEVRNDWREIYNVSLNSYRALNTITKFFNRFDVIEISGGKRVVIPSTEESILSEWNNLCEDLIEKEELIRV